MAIYLTNKDGSDQHFDTYAEFEQAMVLMSRIGGNKVPQDLMDEVSAKYGDKEPKPFKVQIDGKNFESAISEKVREATRELAEALDEVAENRTPESDECEVPEKSSKFEVGDKVKVVNNLSDGHPEGTVGVIDSVSYYPDEGSYSFGVDPERGSPHRLTLYHGGEELESEKDSPTEFRTGDIVKVTETFEDDLGDRTVRGNVYEYDENLGFGEPFVGIVYLGDNADKLQLVCRKEDRKDIEL